jgi:hypothetical protein
MAELYAPKAYWRYPRDWILNSTNGCGSKGFGWLISDRIWWLNINEACRIHDFMYGSGVKEADREEADRVFLNNMTRLISDGVCFLRPLRRIRARQYYLAVRFFGGPSFWNEKNKEGEMGQLP